MMSGLVGIDPGPLVVVAARRASNPRERAAAVGRFPGHDRRNIHDVRIGRVDANIGRIAGPRQDALVAVDRVHDSPASSYR